MLYFSANDGVSGYEPYVTDLAYSTSKLAEINSNGGSNPWNFKEYDGAVYFYATDGLHGNELWVTDGTGPGTEMVFDLNPDGDGTWGD